MLTCQTPPLPSRPSYAGGRLRQNGGRLQIGMLDGIRSEWWAPSDQNAWTASLGIRKQRYGALPMTPQKHKDETLRTLVDITEAAARRQPCVLLFEDAHWADPTTLEVLDLLIDRVRTVPLLVVLTHRPEFQSRWNEQGHVGALNLSKLTRAQSAAMVAALAGGKALPAALLEQILTRTDGVPLFVEELTKSILEFGRTEGGGRSLRVRWLGSHRHHSVHAAGFADGAAG